jgi:microcystin-dependent protein
MGVPYIGEIRMFGGNFAPVGWAFCNGQLLSINNYDALFTLIGTTYGGDGQSTFALPDLRGRVPVHQPNPLSLGSAYGQETVTLITNQMPAHVHSHAAAVPAGNTAPLNKLVADTGAAAIYADGQGASQASPLATASVGGGQPHQNMMPYQGVNFIIALSGIFPSQV